MEMLATLYLVGSNCLPTRPGGIITLMIPQREGAVKGISLKIPERKLKILIG
jgi:hypothetical protein